MLEIFLLRDLTFRQRWQDVEIANAYSKVLYCVLCRDYIADLESNGTSLFSYSAFKAILEEENNLSATIAYMTSDDWLPKTSEDFFYAISSYKCNGVTIRTGLFRTTYSEQLNLVDP